MVVIGAGGGAAAQGEDGAAAPTLAAAQHLYFDGQYGPAAAMALALENADPTDLAACELRTAALLFQIKRIIGEPPDKSRALKACEACPALIAAISADVARGRALARARVKKNPGDVEALFFLGKLNLNYIWLHLGPLGRRTGWSEYREAKRSLDTLLKIDPQHVRARVARAWIDYIVDTKVPGVFQWILGGGDRRRALGTVREAAQADADFFASVEARFALWEMLMREGQVADAVAIARELGLDFPGNRELLRFLEVNGAPRSGAERVHEKRQATALLGEVLDSSQQSLAPLLAALAPHREGQRAQSWFGNGAFAFRAGSVQAGVEPHERFVDARERGCPHLDQAPLDVPLGIGLGMLEVVAPFRRPVAAAADAALDVALQLAPAFAQHSPQAGNSGGGFPHGRLPGCAVSALVLTRP